MGPILVTGGSGQLAQALAAAAGAHPIHVVGRPEFDFDQPDAIPPLLAKLAPRLIVNAAAYTAVDKAEAEPEAAARANHQGPAILAAWCAQAGIPLIHVSTDYVFDGLKSAPYVETDPTGPTGVYGATKLAGEQAALAAHAQVIVLRTAWVYAATGKNFVLSMLGAARKTNRLRVVADQIGNPTSAADLAAAILGITDRIAETGWQDAYAGVYHAAGTGATSWHGLACAVFAASARHGLAAPIVEPIATSDWPTPAKRPANSRLDCTKLLKTFNIRLPDWESTLSRTIDCVFSAQKPTQPA